VTRIGDITQELERWAPLTWADSYDNVGLLWGEPARVVGGVLTTLDVTPAVLKEAQEVGANLIVAHHPLWFGQRTRLAWDAYSDRLIYQLIQADIAVYAIHTNIDQAVGGVSYELCRRLGLRPVGFLRSVGDGYGAGYIGEWAQPLAPADFFRHLRQVLNIPAIRFAPGPDKPIQRVAVCGGAGGFLLGDALQAGVDAYLTADLPYHRFFESDGRLWLVDIGHYESEHHISEALAHYLRQKFPSLPVFSTRLRTNPVHYWV
jgi:dinuclear metal center YbgI/SA1388 family protein